MEKKRDELSLSNLDSHGMDSNRLQEISKEVDHRISSYEFKYGSSWFEHYAMDEGLIPDYDIMLKTVNKAIYAGREPSFVGYESDWREYQKLYVERTHALYGSRYDELVYHSMGDSRVAELLLQDAVKSGKWKELPDFLQKEYKRLVGGGRQ